MVAQKQKRIIVRKDIGQKKALRTHGGNRSLLYSSDEGERGARKGLG